ncbi:Guanylate cyclase soluble subunit beta-2, partial [Bulinus truncatus]
CEDGDDGELILHYYSGRPGLYPIVKGVLKAVARDLFHQSVDMSIIEQNKEDIGFNQSQEHTAFRLTLQGPAEAGLMSHPPTAARDWLPGRLQLLDERAGRSLTRTYGPSEGISFCSAFPYHIIFDRDLRIRQCGDLIQKHSSVKMMEGTPLTHAFSIVHPKMVLSIDNIRKFINAVFLLAMVPRENGRKTMLLKGKLGAAPLHVSHLASYASGMSHSESPEGRTVHSLLPRRPHGAQFFATTSARCTVCYLEGRTVNSMWPLRTHGAQYVVIQREYGIGQPWADHCPNCLISFHSTGHVDHSAGHVDHSAGYVDHSAGQVDHSAGHVDHSLVMWIIALNM